MPSTSDYIKLVRGGMLDNCPITPDDIKVAEKVCGPSVPALKGKTASRKPEPITSRCQKKC